MNKSSISLAVRISLVSLSASAAGVVPTGVPNAAALLSGARQIAKDAGLPTDDIVIAQAPPTPQSLAATSPSKDEVKEAIKSLTAATHSIEPEDRGEIFKAYGINVPPSEIITRTIPRHSDESGYRFFYVRTISGVDRIEISRYVKNDYELKSYLLSFQGDLLSAARSTKSNGKINAVNIPLTDAQEGYKDLLTWWVQYYRENLKGKDQLTAQK